jgi:hypothetical protein
MAVGRISWAVRAAARRVPGASCLTQALALHYLMGRAGHVSQVRIGVAKDAEGRFESHAWLEYQGTVLVGDNGDLARFAPILAVPPLSGKSR